MKQKEFDFPIVDKDLPAGAVLVEDKVFDWDPSYRNRSFFLSEKETAKMITKEFLDIRYNNGKEVNRYRKHERWQKFLCVNGPLAGQLKTEEQAGKDYHRFNNANRPGRDNWPRGVLVCNVFLTTNGMVRIA